ncbi:hypothetical protein [Cyclobacterium sp. SYSU L10401]|uniref:hypothetical protein n=1 Tax=Cyclobacterium sp. SYSU L10401 TaxID=2678657 RepID=UPI0013D27AF8|nr:hypothetical protein [Cyclobacterium sp. SYSU L10401]
MGFIPIFISLGGFVFLFAILVHYNLLQKRKSMQAGLIDIFGLLDQLNTDPAQKDQPPRADFKLTLAEQQFSEIRKSPQENHDPEKIALLGEKILQAKRIRYEHNKLIKTKPYSFVARLLGHRDI